MPLRGLHWTVVLLLFGGNYVSAQPVTIEAAGDMVMRMDRCLIDANWGFSTDVVTQFCRQSPHSGVVTPAHGRYVGASSVPFGEYRRKKGDRAGINWPDRGRFGMCCSTRTTGRRSYTPAGRDHGGSGESVAVRRAGGGAGGRFEGRRA